MINWISEQIFWPFDRVLPRKGGRGLLEVGKGRETMTW